MTAATEPATEPETTEATTSEPQPDTKPEASTEAKSSTKPAAKPRGKSTSSRKSSSTRGKSTAKGKGKTTTARGKSTSKGKSSASTKGSAAVRKAILKRAGLSEGAAEHLEPDQLERLDSDKAGKITNPRKLAEYIMQGGSKSSNGKSRSRAGQGPPKNQISTERRTGPKPEGKLTGLDAARKIVKSAGKRGIKVPAAAVAMLELEPAPITGQYAQANAQKKVYDLIKAGEFVRDEDGKVYLKDKAPAGVS